MPNALNIQAAFNNVLQSLSRGYGDNTNPEQKELAERRLALAERRQVSSEKRNEIAAEKAETDKQKLALRETHEARMSEELFDKQIRTGSLKATREADAAYTLEAANMLKEKTAQEALKRKEEEYKFRQKKARDKKAQERKRAQESAFGEYTSNVEALNGQKIGMKQRKEMLQNEEQIQLEI